MKLGSQAALSNPAVLAAAMKAKMAAASKAGAPAVAMPMTSLLSPKKLPPAPKPVIYTEVRSAGFEDLNDFMQKSLDAYGNSKEVKVDIDRLAKILEPDIPLTTFTKIPLPGTTVLKPSAPGSFEGQGIQFGGRSPPRVGPTVFGNPMIPLPPVAGNPERVPLVLTGKILSDMAKLGSIIPTFRAQNSSTLNKVASIDGIIRSLEVQIKNLQSQIDSGNRSKDVIKSSSKDILDSMKMLEDRYNEMKDLVARAQKRKVELDDLYKEFLEKEARQEAEEKAAANVSAKAANTAADIAAKEVTKVVSPVMVKPNSTNNIHRAMANFLAKRDANARAAAAAGQSGGGRKKINKTRLATRVRAAVKKQLAKTLRRRR